MPHIHNPDLPRVHGYTERHTGFHLTRKCDDCCKRYWCVRFHECYNLEAGKGWWYACDACVIADLEIDLATTRRGGSLR